MKQLFASVMVLLLVGCGRSSRWTGGLGGACIDYMVHARVSQFVPSGQQGGVAIDFRSLMQQQDYGISALAVDFKGKNVTLEIELFAVKDYTQSTPLSITGRSEITNFDVNVQNSIGSLSNSNELSSLHELTRNTVRNALENLLDALKSTSTPPWRTVVASVSEDNIVTVSTGSSHQLEENDIFHIYAPPQNDEEEDVTERRSDFCQSLDRSDERLAVATATTVEDETSQLTLTAEPDARQVQVGDIVELTRELDQQLEISLRLGYVWSYRTIFKVGQRSYSEDLSRLMRHYLLTEAKDYGFVIIP